MPYESAEDVKESVPGTKKLSAKKRRQFMHVFNSAMERGASEESAHKQAWGAVKKEQEETEKSLGGFYIDTIYKAFGRQQ